MEILKAEPRHNREQEEIIELKIGEPFDPGSCKFHPDSIVVSAGKAIGLTDTEKMVYARLIVYKHSYEAVYVSEETLRRDVSKSERTIRRSVGHLAELGLIRVTKRGRSNTYEFLLHPIFREAAIEAGLLATTEAENPDTTSAIIPAMETGHRPSVTAIPAIGDQNTGHSCGRLVRSSEDKVRTSEGKSDCGHASALEEIRTIIDLHDSLGRKPDDRICRNVLGILKECAAFCFMKEQVDEARERGIRSYGLVLELAKDARGRFEVAQKNRAREERRRLDLQPPRKQQVQEWLQPLNLPEALQRKALDLITSAPWATTAEVKSMLNELATKVESSKQPWVVKGFRVNGKPVTRCEPITEDRIMEHIRMKCFPREFLMGEIERALVNLPAPGGPPDHRGRIKRLAEVYMGRAPVPGEILDHIVEAAGYRPWQDLIWSLANLRIHSPILATQWRGLIQGFCPACHGGGWRFPGFDERINHTGGYAEQDCRRCIKIWLPMDPKLEAHTEELTKS